MEDKRTMSQDEKRGWKQGYQDALDKVVSYCSDLIKIRWENDLREVVEENYKARNWNLTSHDERDNKIQNLLHIIKDTLRDNPEGCGTRELETACEEPHKLLFDEALLLGVKKAEIYWQFNANVWKAGGFPNVKEEE